MSGFDPKHFAEGTYQFTRPIRRVAVIGGGPSGVSHGLWHFPGLAPFVTADILLFGLVGYRTPPERPGPSTSSL